MPSIDLPRRDETPTPVFNPLKSDFTLTYRDDDNTPREYMIRSMEIGTFPAYLAKHFAKHLLTAVLNERGKNPLDPIIVEEIRKEIEVVI